MKKAAVAFIVVVVVLGAFLFAFSVSAQQGKVYRVGVLAPPGKAEERVYIKGLRDGLRKIGYAENNLQLNIPTVKTYDELRPIAKGYVEKRTDAIVTQGGTATSIAKEATQDIPIIFISGISDPVQARFVKSLARPETNITGLSSFTDPKIFGKRLELFKEAVPNLERVILLYNARGENPGHAKSLGVVRETARKLGLTLNEKPAKSVDDVDEMLRTVSRKTTDGI